MYIYIYISYIIYVIYYHMSYIIIYYICHILSYIYLYLLKIFLTILTDGQEAKSEDDILVHFDDFETFCGKSKRKYNSVNNS